MKALASRPCRAAARRSAATPTPFIRGGAAPFIRRAAALVVALAALAASAAPPPADAKTAAACSSVFIRMFSFVSDRDRLEDEASERGDTAAVAASFDRRAEFLGQLADTAGLPATTAGALRSLGEVRSIQAAAMRGLAAALDADADSAWARWQPALEATDALYVRAFVSLLATVGSAGAGETAAIVAPLNADSVRVVLGDEPVPQVSFDGFADPELRRRATRVWSSVPVPPPAPKHVVRDTPEARAVTAVVAAIAREQRKLIEATTRATAARGGNADPAVNARIVKAEVEALRKIPLAGCPAPFRKAFGDYGRCRVGIGTALETLAAAERNSPEENAAFADFTARIPRQVADKAALLREARAAGADTEPLFEPWCDAFLCMALAPRAPAARPDARPGAAAASPAQRHADALAALEGTLKAEMERAPGGAAGAKTRLAAFRAFYAGAKALDVSALPKDAARAHANFLAAMRPVGRAMQSLSDAGAKGPAAFLAAAQAAQGELSSLEQTAKTAARQLKDTLRRAGADVSALDLEIAD